MSEISDDDDVDELPPPQAYAHGGQRGSVSAEAYGDWNRKKTYDPKVIPKSDEQKARLKEVLCKSFLFSNLEDKALAIVVDAMKECRIRPNQRIIKEGEDGHVLYIVDKGTLDCFKVDRDGSERIVKTCVAGDAFGELALLYNCPRAASVHSRDECLLWELDRETFNAIVKDAAAAKRQQHEGFLRSVGILRSLSTYDIYQIADALEIAKYEPGECVVRQGETGETFFIIEEGRCVATKRESTDDEAKEVMELGVGEYFGELALLRDEPRAATVTTITKTKVLGLNRKTFKDLLGPLTLQDTSRYF